MDEGCLYYGPPGLAVKLGAQDTSDMMAKAKAGAHVERRRRGRYRHQNVGSSSRRSPGKTERPAEKLRC